MTMEGIIEPQRIADSNFDMRIGLIAINSPSVKHGE